MRSDGSLIVRTWYGPVRMRGLSPHRYLVALAPLLLYLVMFSLLASAGSRLPNIDSRGPAVLVDVAFLAAIFTAIILAPLIFTLRQNFANSDYAMRPAQSVMIDWRYIEFMLIAAVALSKLIVVLLGP